MKYNVYINDGDTGGLGNTFNGGAGFEFNVLNDAIAFCIRVTQHKQIETGSGGTQTLRYLASLVTPTGISYYYNGSVQ
jgi:hypothetical protein